MLIPVADQLCGDRSGRLADFFGHAWIVATHLEGVPAAEMQRRVAAWPAPQGAKKKEERTMAVKPIPDGYGAAIPYLSVVDAAAAIEFYKRAFGAAELMRMVGADGRVNHAEIKIGTALLMLADEHPEIDFRSPKSLGIPRSPVGIHLYVEDVDAVYTRAVQAGATGLREPADQFYGDRNAQVQDPSGHVWFLSTHTEDVSPEEVRRRLAALAKPR